MQGLAKCLWVFPEIDISECIPKGQDFRQKHIWLNFFPPTLIAFSPEEKVEKQAHKKMFAQLYSQQRN